MLKRLFPSESSRYKHIQNLVKRINSDIIDRLEIFFPMWLMFAFQHYLIKSYDIAIFSAMNIEPNRFYMFSMITEDWIGIVNILFHSLLFLWLMNRFESFGPFRSVKVDCQTNFLLFLTIYSFIDVLIFGKMMIGLFLLFLVLYILYRSDSVRSKVACLVLTMIVLAHSINQDEPILSTSAILFLPFLIISSSIIFVFRLFWVQLINVDDVKLSNKNSVEKVYNYPERGYIYDRNKKLIVGNEPFYDLMIVPSKLKLVDTIEFCEILKIDKQTLLDKIKKAKNYSRIKPSVFLAQISKNDYAVIQEKLWKYDGFSVRKKSNRNYLLNSASNILGYISEVNDYEINDNSYYESGELIGRQGIEKSYEKQLRGVKGVSYFQKDNFNRITGRYKEGVYDTLFKPSKNIDLTIDSELQVYGDSLMINKFGSIIAIEPESGEILSLINAPNFDPNLLIGRNRSKNYINLKNDTIGKPLFDRGLQGMYPPGSTFKLINGLIALEENIITEKTKISCNEGHFYSKNRFMRCHCKPGTKNDLNTAIYNSCNTYFANIYKRTIEKFPSHKNGINNWSQ